MRKNESIRSVYRTISHFIIAILVIAGFAYKWFGQLMYITGRFPNWRGSWILVGLYAGLFLVFTYILDGFKIGTNKASDVLLSQGLAIVISDVFQTLIIVLISGQSRQVAEILQTMGIFFVEHFVIQELLAWIFVTLYYAIFPPYHVLVINGEYRNNLSQKFGTRGDKYELNGEIECTCSMEVLAKEIAKYDAILINDVPSEKRNKILKCCFDLKKRVYLTPKISDIIVRSSEEINLFDTPLYFCQNQEMSFGEKIVKRLGDVIMSLIGLIISSPIMLITAIAIKAYDGGPVFYRQTRCTQDGKEFKIYKFRSMITDAEKDGKARLATENDSRITPVGKFIRATRVDELPQFINILVGDMSMVGPRPERPEINKEYCEEVPEFAYRLKVKAGLTGYAQVYGKYNTTSYDKLKLDLIYVEKMSIWLDVKILFLTLKTVLKKEATEGIDEGQTTSKTMGMK